MAWLSVARSQETLPSGRMVEEGLCAFTGLGEDSLASGPLLQPSSKCRGLAMHEVCSVSVARWALRLLGGPVCLVAHLVLAMGDPQRRSQCCYLRHPFGKEPEWSAELEGSCKRPPSRESPSTRRGKPVRGLSGRGR